MKEESATRKKDVAHKSETRLMAELSLPEELRPVFDKMIDEYQFAALKHHGCRIVSPKVIAELIMMGWRSL